MRAPVTKDRLERFLRALGTRASGPGRVYLAGGTTAVAFGWRPSTVDIDLKLDPEPAGAFEAIAALKDELDINVELASPDLFVPVPADWAARSAFLVCHGKVEFFHFDYRAQALAKLARGHDRDLGDVRAMLARDLVSVPDLLLALEEVEPKLVRYPGIDAEAFVARARAFLGGPA